MEQRKIIKLGPSSYAITLPASWIDSNHVVDQKFVFLKEHSKYLSVHTNLEENRKKTVTIDFDPLPLKVFNKLLISYYLKNYSHIEIKGERISQDYEQIKIYVDKLPHLEIVSLDTNKLILEDSSIFKGIKIEDIFVSLESILTSMMQCLELTNFQEVFLKMQILDKSTNKTYFKCIKALNYYIDEQENFEIIKRAVYYLKIATLYEKIGDNMKRMSRYLKRYCEDQEFSFGETVQTLLKVQQLIIDYRKSTPKHRLEILGTINDKKMTILREIEERVEQHTPLYQIELVVFQFIKDTLGNFDEVLIANIDAYGLYN